MLLWCMLLHMLLTLTQFLSPDLHRLALLSSTMLSYKHQKSWDVISDLECRHGTLLILAQQHWCCLQVHQFSVGGKSQTAALLPISGLFCGSIYEQKYNLASHKCALSILNSSCRVQTEIVKVCTNPSIPAKCARSGSFKTQVLRL